MISTYHVLKLKLNILSKLEDNILKIIYKPNTKTYKEQKKKFTSKINIF